MIFTFMDFPVLGDQSYRIAEATWCALDQDRFWEYHDTIFANHPSQGGEALTDERLLIIAEAIGLEMDQFTTCYESREHEQDVLDSFQEGVAAGVSSTPSIFVNGEKVDYRGWEDLAELLDSQLEES